MNKRVCAHKKKYTNKAWAYHDLNALRKRGERWITVYFCKGCGCFHIGHLRAYERERIRARWTGEQL